MPIPLQTCGSQTMPREGLGDKDVMAGGSVGGKGAQPGVPGKPQGSAALLLGSRARRRAGSSVMTELVAAGVPPWEVDRYLWAVTHWTEAGMG